MNNSHHILHAAPPPWYRQLWPWLLMAGPAAVLLAGAVTCWLAWHSPAPLVVEDYYRAGKAVNQALAQQAHAATLQLSAQLQQTLRPGTGGARLEVHLESAVQAPLPDQLRLNLTHPTQPAEDRNILLTEDTPGQYQAVLPAPLHGHWQLSLEDPHTSWRIQGWAQLDISREVGFATQ